MINHVTILINPHASGGTSEHRVHAIHKKMLDGVAITWLDITKIEKMPDLEPNARLLVAGGDGTVHMLLQRMYDEKNFIPFGIIPAGTGNVLARSLGLPKKIKEALNFSLKVPARPIDLLLVNGKTISVIGSGLGAHATVMKNTPGFLKRLLGVNAYYLMSFSQLLPIRQHTFGMAVDENPSEQVKMNTLIIANTINMPTRPIDKTKPDDGFLHIISLKHRWQAQYIWDLIQLGRGKSGSLGFVTSRPAHRVTFSGVENIIAQVDGEHYPEALHSIEVMPHAAMMYY